MKKIQTTLAVLLTLTMGLIWAAESATSEKTGKSGQEAEQPAAENSAEKILATKAGAPTGTVSRAGFTSAIENREPTDKLGAISNDQTQIMYFTELRDMAGQSVTHRWEHKGKVMAEVPFNINGNRWRVYSSKQLDPSWTGKWKASVINANGETLSVSTFNYEIASEPITQTPATPTETAPATESPSTTQ